MSTPIRQTIRIKARPEQIYGALTDGKKFSAFTSGAPAEVTPDPGAAFSCFGGMIVGRNIELVPNRRVVQAWRAGTWAEGVYSIVRFEIVGQGAETEITFDHTGFPDDQRSHLESGWQAMYWQPLRAYLE